jgi:hypothetical protein
MLYPLDKKRKKARNAQNTVRIFEARRPIFTPKTFVWAKNGGFPASLAARQP